MRVLFAPAPGLRNPVVKLLTPVQVLAVGSKLLKAGISVVSAIVPAVLGNTTSTAPLLTDHPAADV